MKNIQETKDKDPQRGHLSGNFIKSLNGEGKFAYYKDIIEFVRNDNDLDIQVRDNYFNIYYHGGNILRLGPQSQQFDKFYFYTKKEYGKEMKHKTHLEQIAKGERDGNKKDANNIINKLNNKAKNLIIKLRTSPDDYFKEAKDVMDKWFEDNPNQERKDQQEITLANRTFSSDNDLVIIDIEFAVSTKKSYNKAKNKKGKEKVCRFDMIAVDRTGQLYVIELKQNPGADSEDNTSNMKVHKEDFDNTVGKDINNDFAKEMKGIVNLKKKLHIFGDEVKVDVSKKPIFVGVYSEENGESVTKHWIDLDIQVLNYKNYKLSL